MQRSEETPLTTSFRAEVVAVRSLTATRDDRADSGVRWKSETVASGINIYSHIVTSLIRISDISNSS